MRSWAERLVSEYNTGKNRLEVYRNTLDPADPLDQEELKVIGGMISDMQYALDWMRRGRRPGGRRGAESTDAYRRAALMDMDLFPSLDLSIPEVELTDDQKRGIVDVLLRLSNRERQCYLLHMAQGMSVSEIGRELKISKRTAQQYIERSKGKVKQFMAL